MELAIMCGLPRSGKTTHAKSLEEHGWVRICPDDIRLAIHGAQFIGSAEPLVWAIAEVMARTFLIADRKVIIDATNTTRRRREQWVSLAKDVGVRLHIYWQKTSVDICLERNGIGVEAHLDPAVIERMHQQFEPPTKDEGIVYMPVFGPESGLIPWPEPAEA